jgi:hypothetical protein
LRWYIASRTDSGSSASYLSGGNGSSAVSAFDGDGGGEGAARPVGVDEGGETAFVADDDGELEAFEQEATLTRTRNTTTQAHTRRIRARLEDV